MAAKLLRPYGTPGSREWIGAQTTFRVHVGLAQIQFDAPRPLAHAYLFEVDAHLDGRSVNAFTRWMDDINVGVDSVPERKGLLRDLDEMIATMGLRLRGGKTRIVTGDEALSLLWMNENRRLNWLFKYVLAGSNPDRAREYTRRTFLEFWNAPSQGNWAKVLRRYFTVFTKLADTFLDSRVPAVLRDLP